MRTLASIFDRFSMRRVTLTFLFLLSCQEKRGEVIDNADSATELMLISSGELMPYKTIRINSVDFDLVVNEKTDTIYLATRDKNFETPEGYAVGTKFAQL